MAPESPGTRFLLCQTGSPPCLSQTPNRVVCSPSTGETSRERDCQSQGPWETRGNFLGLTAVGRPDWK